MSIELIDALAALKVAANQNKVTSAELGVTYLARDHFPGMVYVTDLDWYAASTSTGMWKNISTLAQVGVTDETLAINAVFQGDSLTSANGVTVETAAYPYVTITDMPTSGYQYAMSDIATSGITAAEIYSNFGTDSAPKFDSAAFLNFFMMLAGTNFKPVTEPKQTYRDIRSVFREAEATGFDRRIVATLPSKNTDPTDADNAFDGNTLPLNIYIRTYGTSDLNCDAVADFAADSRFDTASDADSTEIYFDKEHIADAGHVVLASITAATMTPLLTAPGVRTAAPATWSIFDHSDRLQLTNDNRTLSWINQDDFGSAMAHGFPAIRTGKHAWETIIDDATQVYVGLCNISFESSIYTDFNTLGQTSDSVSWVDDTILLNNITLATVPLLVNGDVVQHAVDFDNKLYWLRTVTGQWNGNADADPVTGTGGLDISALGTRPLYPAGGMYSAPGQITTCYLASQMTAQLSGFSALSPA